MVKLNCWESAKCGRQEGGDKVAEDGVCPAATEKRLHGRNNGVNGGRACWVVTGTLCDKEKHGDFANKLQRCKRCQFYIKVHEEEGSDIVPLMDLFTCLVDMDSDIR